MDLHFIDAGGNHFVVPDAPDGYDRPDATQVVAPPSEQHRWIDGEWQVPATPQLTLAERRAVHLPQLAKRRWEIETGGIEAMGVPVRTDEVGQAKLTGAIVAFDNDPTMTTIDWEAQPGIWLTLDKPTILGLGVLVAQHVQACFSRARVISEAIQSAHTHALMDDAVALIEPFWPQF